MTELLGTIPGLRLVVLMDAIQSESTEEWAEKIANTPVKQAVVEQFVHEALDPARRRRRDLLAFILGPKRGQDMVAALRRTYATIREKYPKEMVDVDRVWNEQRTWWKQFPPPGGEPSGSSSSSTQPFSMVYRRYLPFAFVFPTHDDPARVAPRVRRRHLPFAFVFPTHDDPARVAPRVRRRHLPFAFVFPTHDDPARVAPRVRRRHLPFAFVFPTHDDPARVAPRVRRRHLPFAFVFPTHDDPARVAPRVRRRHLPFAFVFPTHDDPARVAPRVRRRHLPFAFVFPTHDDPARVAPRVRRRHLPFAFVLRTPERPLLRRRRSAAERKRRGPAVHRLETTLVSAALLDRIQQFAQETGYSVATVAAGALRLGLTNYLRTTQAKTPPSKRRRGAHRVVTYVSKPLADRVETAALENGRSESEILAGAISCGLGRWRRSQIEGDAPGPSDSSHTHAERS